jgi:hypothetical protein
MRPTQGDESMTASGGDTLTKLHLKQGESSARSWELVSASVATTLTVGAAADCSWVVHADGVRARHLTLQWDGAQLRVADLAASGDASLNGQVLGANFEVVHDGALLAFGKALLSVESQRMVRPDVHPLDLGMPAAHSAPPVATSTPAAHVASAPPASASGASTPLRKQTLLGVAPITLEPPSAKGSSSSVPPGGDGFRVLRPSESNGRRPSSNPPGPPPAGSSEPHAAPYAGTDQASSAEPPSPVVEVMSAPPGDTAPSVSAGKAAAMRSGTLIGVAVPEILHSLRTKRSGSLADDEQRTLHGYVAPPPGSGDSVARAGTVQVRGDGRGGGPAADATQRIGSAWQESPFNGVSAFGGADPRATLNETRPSGVLDSPPVGASPGVDTWPAREAGATEPLAGPPLTNTSPVKAGLPLRYVGIALLTVVAYFAWLYLLDHL